MAFTFGFLHFLFAISSLHLEMLLIWFYVNRKSELLTTAIDLINRDTVISHTTMLSSLYVIYYLVSFVDDNFVFSPISALIMTGWFHMLVAITMVYYSLGITLRYIYIRNQRMELSETWSDRDVQVAARFFAIGIGVVFIAVHISMGGVPRFYNDLTRLPGRDVWGMIFVIFLLFIAIILNVTFRINIRRIRHQNVQEMNKTADLKSAVAIFAFVIFFTGICTSVLIAQENPDALAILRVSGVVIGNGIPIVVMCTSTDFVNYILNKSRLNIDKFVSLFDKDEPNVVRVTPLPA